MKFLMLLRKELRESLPWILLAAIVLLATGAFLLRVEIRMGRADWHYSRLSPGSTVGAYELTRYSVLAEPGAWLFAVSIGLGLILGVQHFWIPGFTRTWPFLLHRSVSRMSILGAKLAAATIGFVASLGFVWIAFYWYVCRPEVLPVPAPVRVFIDGWVFIVLGLVVYLATALTGLSRARWYTTKIFGLAFLTLILFATVVQCSPGWALVVIVISIVVLLSQVIDRFLNREY